MFFRKKKIDDHAKKIDKLVTWLIIGWAVASMIWLSKTDKWKEIKEKATENVWWIWKNIVKKWYSIFWKALVKWIRLFTKK